MKNLTMFPCKADKSPDISGGSWKVFNKSYYDAGRFR